MGLMSCPKQTNGTLKALVNLQGEGKQGGRKWKMHYFLHGLACPPPHEVVVNYR